MAGISVNAGPGVTTVHDALITPGMLGQGGAPAGAPTLASGLAAAANDMSFATPTDSMMIEDVLGGASVGGNGGWGGDVVDISANGALGGGGGWGGDIVDTSSDGALGGGPAWGSGTLIDAIRSALGGLAAGSSFSIDTAGGGGSVVGGGAGGGLESVDVAGILGGAGVGGNGGGWTIDGAGGPVASDLGTIATTPITGPAQPSQPAATGGGASNLGALTGLLSTAASMAMALGGLTGGGAQR